MSTTASDVVLPKLDWQESRNQSARSPGIVPYPIVAHRPVGNQHGSADWLPNPKVQASAHVLTEGNETGVDEATQLLACGLVARPPRHPGPTASAPKEGEIWPPNFI